MTSFPHAVLEVKLSLPEGEEEPTWVTDLVGRNTDLCAEVHKFSKFIQGTATLFPRDVQVCTGSSISITADGAPRYHVIFGGVDDHLRPKNYAKFCTVQWCL